MLVREERELVLAELAVAPRGVQIREEAAYKGNDERVERDADDLDYHSVDLRTFPSWRGAASRPRGSNAFSTSVLGL